MKKRLFITIITLILLTTHIVQCYAMDLNEKYRIECINNLAKYGFNIFVSDINEGITRREVFELCYKLQNDNEDPYEAIVKYYNGDLIENVFKDVKKYSKDYYFAQLLLEHNLIKGELIEDSLYARFDDDITYGEALTIILRALSRNGYFIIDYDTLVVRYGANNTYYCYAEDIGLINTKNPADNFSIKISIEDLSKKMPVCDFVVLLDRALYIPSTSPGDYAPSVRYYTIDKYMKYNLQFFNGEISEYTLKFVGIRYDILSSATGQEGQNPIIVKIDDVRNKVFMYDENLQFPTEIYMQGTITRDELSNIIIGTSTFYDVKKIDPNANYAIPYSRDENICSLHCTVDDELLLIYYEVIEQGDTNVSMVVSNIVVI